MAGSHGDEMAGVLALRELAAQLELTKGQLYLVMANPAAIRAGKRMLVKNLNRCFYRGNKGQTWEDNRARQIMKILDQCDALLDLHMFHDESGKPFVICEENALEIAGKFDVEIISTNWSKTEPGAADGYMYEQGKVGICVECGPKSQPEKYKDFAKQTVLQFLKYFEMIDEEIEFSAKPKEVIEAKQTIYKTSTSFKLEPGFENFKKLKLGQLIAHDDGAGYYAETGDYIIFPHYGAKVGEEACIIGAEKPKR